MSTENKISRRQVIGGLGATVATLAISPVFADPKKMKLESFAPTNMEDPTTKYPKPPFKSQSAAMAGLSRQNGSGS